MIQHRGEVIIPISALSILPQEAGPNTEPITEVPVPTTEQVDAAVSGMEHDVLEEDEDDQWGALIGRTTRGPRYLNAFDLVSQCGGFHLKRLFNPQSLRTLSTNSLLGTITTAKEEPLQNAELQPTTVQPAVEAKVLRSVKSVRFNRGSLSKQRDSMNFTSSVVSAEDLMKAVYDALKSMKFVLESSVDTAMASGNKRRNIYPTSRK